MRQSRILEIGLYWCFNKFPVIWLSGFQLSGFKLAKEGAWNSSWKFVNESSCSCNCRIADYMCNEFNIATEHLWLQVGNDTTRRRFPVYLQRLQRLDCQSKITCQQVCVLARQNLLRFFFVKNLSKADIALACWHEKDLQFSWVTWVAKVHTLPWKLIENWNKKFAEIRAGSLAPLDSAHAAGYPCPQATSNTEFF